MEQHCNGKEIAASRGQIKGRVNVQQFRAGHFEQPEQLGFQFDQSEVQEFCQDIITETIINSWPETAQSKGQSLQLQNNINRLMLQLKTQQPKKISQTSTSANEKQCDKIQQRQQQKGMFKSGVRTSQDQTQHVQLVCQQPKGDYPLSNSDLNLIAQYKQQTINDEQQLELEKQVVDLEKMIKDYREELNKAEYVGKKCRQRYQKRIQQLEAQLRQIRLKLLESQALNLELQEQFLDLQQNNQALYAEIQSNFNSNSQNVYYEQLQLQPKRKTDQHSPQHQPSMQTRRYNIGENRQPNGSHDNDEYCQMSPFDSSVQIQLQKLIQKLIRQLQYERSLKKKTTDQMKVIQKELSQTGKQIMSKNKIIYQLQMELIKSQKYNYFNGSKVAANTQPTDFRKYQNQRHPASNGSQITTKIKQNRPIKDKQPQKIIWSFSPSQQRKNRPQFIEITKNKLNTSFSPSNSNKLLQSFTLLQLLTQATITLTVSQKLHISKKIVNFYEQKIYQHINYRPLMLENVVVTNFNRINLRLIKIRANETLDHSKGKYCVKNQSQSQELAEGPQKVIWNLGFILSSFLLDVPSKQQDFGVSSLEKNILSEIQMILDKKNLNEQAVSKLACLFQQASKQRSNK